MTTLKTYTLGVPFKGLATRIDPFVAASKGFLAVANNVTYDEVAITPMPKLLPGVAQIPSDTYFLYYHFGAGWIYDNVRLNTGAYNWGMRGARTVANYTVSYVTTIASNGTVGKIKKYLGTINFDMGIDAPTAAPSLSAGARGNVTACITYSDAAVPPNFQLDDVVESNPSALTASTAGGGTLTVSWTGVPARVTRAKVYATEEGSPDGTLYYAGEIVRPATTLNMTPYTRNLDIALNWGPGGFIGNTNDIFSDHAASPSGVTCLSDRPHGSEAGAADDRGSILFYAVDNIVGWTETGQPEYFPAVNRYTLPSTVQALVTLGTQTFAFLTDQVWVFTGQHSSAIAARQLSTRRGVQIGKAKTVQSTPYGIVYCSQEGLVVFNGSDARLICREVLREFNDTDHWVAAYIDGMYYLCKPPASGSWRVDLAADGGPIVTTTSINFWASYTMAQDSARNSTGSIITEIQSLWNSATTYAINQSVRLDSSQVSKAVSLQSANTNNNPILSPAWWAVVPTGQTYFASASYDQMAGNPPTWLSTVTYATGDVVYHEGVKYQAAAPSTNQIPTGSAGNPWTTFLTRFPVCPYTEDQNTNPAETNPLPITIKTHYVRLGALNSTARLRRFRTDGRGNATLSFSFEGEESGGRFYSVEIASTEEFPPRAMLPMSLYGKYFTVKIESSSHFQLRLIEVEGSVNR